MEPTLLQHNPQYQTLPVCDEVLIHPVYRRWIFSAYNLFFIPIFLNRRSQWPRGLRRRSAAARLLRLWARIPPGTWMFVCCECCVLSGRGLCDGLITRPEESYRLWCVCVSVISKNLKNEEAIAHDWAASAIEKKLLISSANTNFHFNLHPFLTQNIFIIQ